MRIGTIGKNKPETNFIVVSNRETTAIPNGTPVVFVMDGTDDGLAVQLPTSSDSSKAVTLAAGIASGQGVGTLLASGVGQVVQVYGICQQAMIESIVTRAATTDIWATVAASAAGAVLTVDTVGNALGFFSNGSAIKACHPFVLAQSLASRATQASTVTFAGNSGGASSNTIAYVTSLAKVFVRLM